MIDELDGGLIELLTNEPRVGVLEASRRLGVARGTVQARLDRLHARGVITGYGPDIDPAALGYSVMAFVTLEISQIGGHDPIARRHGGNSLKCAEPTTTRAAATYVTTGGAVTT